MFCKHCGAEIADQAVICVKCGVPNSPDGGLEKSSKTRVAYVLLGVFLGGLGVHNFYAGRTGIAIAQLLISIFTGWLIFPLLAVGIWVLIELFTVTKDGKGKRFS
jgi:TM2 domain-containing membrane protein YozV